MIIIQYILLSGFLVLTLQAGDPNNLFLNLTAKYSYNHIILVCDVRGLSSQNYSTYLKCPFGVNEICYTNCAQFCSKKDCGQIISDCLIKSDQSTHTQQITYTIDVSKVTRTGNWYCVHKNKQSNNIYVEKQLSTEKSSTKNPIISSTTVKVNVVDVVTVREIRKTPPNSLENHPTDTNHPSDFWIFITNPNVVLILVCVFTVSLLFNILFLIRCALLRTVIDHYIQSNKISDSCLYRCFCIRVTDGLPQVSLKSVPKPNSSNAFVGYHREDVYDDMSASSQAERHLISNYSQYELEQETLLNRKFWSHDMSQSMLARQSQFYQTPQPMSNYVIVSGPVCSNLNHGPYMPPSTTSFLTNSQRTCITDDLGQPSSHESVCNDSIIYSQPMKNRPKSLGQFSDGETVKVLESGPPAPPIRMCTDTQCYRNSIPHIENMQQPVTMKNVDLIEHCTHSNVINNPPQENLS